MKMFVGNATRQLQDFTYTLPDKPGQRRQTIPIGGQIQITGDLSQADVDFIVKHHAVYGMVRVADINRAKVFAGLCWDDKPILVSRLTQAIHHNTDVLVEQGRLMRQEAAVATHQALETTAAETGGPLVKGLDMSTVEEEPKGGYGDDHNPVGEGTKVVAGAAPQARPGSRRK